MPTSLRLVVGLAVAPLGAAVTAAGLVALLGYEPVTTAIWVAIFAYAAELVIALPGHLFLRRQRISTRRAYATLGAVTGVAPFGLFASSGADAQFAYWAVVGAAAGAIAGMIFWSIVFGRERGQADA